MSFLSSLLGGELLAQLAAGLMALLAVAGTLFGVRQSGINKGKADAAHERLKDMADAARTRDDIQAGIDGSSDDAVRQRLRDKWTRKDGR